MRKKVPNTAPKASFEAIPVFDIKLPLLWLAAAVLILYLPTLQFGFTDLDDSIFIREMREYNQDVSNLVVSFQRGVFHPTNDSYYRPLFLDSVILNTQISDQSIVGFRFVNILLHLGCVLLLFNLFLKLGIQRLHAFLLGLLFAVHPVISQAVVWIPGRNDSLMGVFVLSYLIYAIDYSQKQKFSSLLLSLLFLLCAFFTKETAIFAPAVAFLLQIFVLKLKPLERRQLIQYAAWIAGIVLYLFVRSAATLKPNGVVASQMVNDFLHRLPLIVQYLGKVFLPFNLSVFPILQDTVYYFGIVAIILLAAIIYFTKDKKWNYYIAGFGIFIIFLLPVLFVPNSLNEQTFEHRLYLPLIGILLLLSQTVLFKNNLSERNLAYYSFAVIGLFALINYTHQKYFKDALSFWEQAYDTSPNSAYATMMYGARVENKQEGYALMRKAYSLNPNEKYLNYYYGMMLQNQDSLLQSEPYFLKEKKNSGYYECDFYLAKVAFYKKNFIDAATYLESYIKIDKANEMANNNLLLLYKSEFKDKQKTQAQLKRMQENGIMVSPEVIQQVQQMP